jgi:hypothetical protein
MATTATMNLSPRRLIALVVAVGFSAGCGSSSSRASGDAASPSSSGGSGSGSSSSSGSSGGAEDSGGSCSDDQNVVTCPSYQSCATVTCPSGQSCGASSQCDAGSGLCNGTSLSYGCTGGPPKSDGGSGNFCCPTQGSPCNHAYDCCPGLSCIAHVCTSQGCQADDSGADGGEDGDTDNGEEWCCLMYNEGEGVNQCTCSLVSTPCTDTPGTTTFPAGTVVPSCDDSCCTWALQPTICTCENTTGIAIYGSCSAFQGNNTENPSQCPPGSSGGSGSNSSSGSSSGSGGGNSSGSASSGSGSSSSSGSSGGSGSSSGSSTCNALSCPSCTSGTPCCTSTVLYGEAACGCSVTVGSASLCEQPSGSSGGSAGGLSSSSGGGG